MNQFYLHHDHSPELSGFSHIREIAIRKYASIQLDSLSTSATESIRIYYIMDGKFEWLINDRCHVLYPGDLAIVLPGQAFGGSKGFMDIGTLCWICIDVERVERNKRMVLGKWSGLSET